ncbi:MAG: type II secretion system F family protein, partial [Patescibacteria group bacterium]
KTGLTSIETANLYDLKDRVGRGEKFSVALAAWPDQFNPIFISLVKAGETSGNLPSILLSYAQELRKDFTFNRKLKAAMVYPLILITALLAMILLVLIVVIPRLQELFISLKATPPFYTKIFFVASDFLGTYTIPVLLFFALVGFGGFFAMRNRKMRRHIDVVLWRLPILNKIQRNLTLMRFSKTVSSLIQTGFPLKSALLVSGGVMSLRYEQALKTIAEKRLETGVTFADALKEYPELFPEVLTSVIATGEKTGQLSSVLAQMADFYEEEVIYGLEILLTLVEPILLVVVGIVVGLLASSLIAPIYRLIGSF